MNGPEHYRQAEKWVGYAQDLYRSDGGEEAAASAAAAVAQVHASLALAAALVGLDAIEGPGGGSASGRTVEDANEWARAVAPLVATDVPVTTPGDAETVESISSAVQVSAGGGEVGPVGGRGVDSPAGSTDLPCERAS